MKAFRPTTFHRVVLFGLFFAALLVLSVVRCDRADAKYLGMFAPSDTVAPKGVWFNISYNDTSGNGNVTNLTTFKAILSMNGVVYDSVGMAGTHIAYYLPRQGQVYGRFYPSVNTTTYGTGFAQYYITIQGLVVACSDNWRCDSLSSYESNLANLDASVASAKTLTAGERQAIRDTVWKDARADTVGIHVWNVATKAVTSIPAATLTTGERATVGVSVRDSVWNGAGADNQRNATAESVWAGYPTRKLSPAGGDSVAVHVWNGTPSTGTATTLSGYSAIDVWTYPTRRLTAAGGDSIGVHVWNSPTRTITGGTTVTTSDMSAIADTILGRNLFTSGNMTLLDGFKAILGLSQHNYYMDDLDFAGGLMTQARVRIYSDTTSVGTASNVIGTYRITADYDGNNLQTYKVVKE